MTETSFDEFDSQFCETVFCKMVTCLASWRQFNLLQWNVNEMEIQKWRRNENGEMT